jgi:signal-transduction protein with cAMP-binding, CBS, and nucleotidyltransferase domain
MVTIPKTMSLDATVGQAFEAFENSHVHMLLLGEDGILVGTVVREDLVPAPPATTPAVAVSRLIGRTVSPDQPVAEVLVAMQRHGQRRLAVVGPDDRLLGLLCLKRDQTGFCTDRGVAARAAERAARDHRPLQAPGGSPTGPGSAKGPGAVRE